MRKAFEKQTKTIEDQGEKQKKKKTIEKYGYKADDDPIILKENKFIIAF